MEYTVEVIKSTMLQDGKEKIIEAPMMIHLVF